VRWDAGGAAAAGRRIPDASAADRKIDGVHAPLQNIITPTLIVLTIFSCCLVYPAPASAISAWWR